MQSKGTGSFCFCTVKGIRREPFSNYLHYIKPLVPFVKGILIRSLTDVFLYWQLIIH